MRRLAFVAACLLALPAAAGQLHTLKASGAETSSSTESAVLIPDGIEAAIFFFDVTVAATDADDTLNCYVQKSPNQGTDWQDVVSFTQAVGNGGAVAYMAEWVRDFGAAPENEMGAVQDAALAAGNVDQGATLGDRLRLKCVVVDPSGSNASFTYSATMLID